MLERPLPQTLGTSEIDYFDFVPLMKSSSDQKLAFNKFLHNEKKKQEQVHWLKYIYIYVCVCVCIYIYIKKKDYVFLQCIYIYLVLPVGAE